MSDEARPPYVKFEMRAVEDRTASVEKGQYVAKDVVFALITPAGTKDVLEKEAEAWIEGLDEAAKQERIPFTWPTLYRQMLQAWKDGHDDPTIGTPIKSWPQVSPAQAANILAANVRTIEDLAEASEEALGRIGMGAQSLKAKARAWLDSAAATGKPAAELESLRQELAALSETNSKLQKRITDLEAQKSKEKA